MEDWGAGPGGEELATKLHFSLQTHGKARRGCEQPRAAETEVRPGVAGCQFSLARELPARVRQHAWKLHSRSSSATQTGTHRQAQTRTQTLAHTHILTSSHTCKIVIKEGSIEMKKINIINITV